jgi:hypothetical protein
LCGDIIESLKAKTAQIETWAVFALGLKPHERGKLLKLFSKRQYILGLGDFSGSKFG